MNRIASFLFPSRLFKLRGSVDDIAESLPADTFLQYIPSYRPVLVFVCVWPVMFFAIREAEKEPDKSVFDK